MAAPLDLDRKLLDRKLLDRELLVRERLGGRGNLGLVGVAALRKFLRPPRRPHDFRRRRWRKLAIAAVAVALIVARWRASTQNGAVGDLLAGRYEVAAIPAGDTLRLADHSEIRLLGVASRADRDAAAVRLAGQFIAGQDVRIEFARTRLDSAGRWLCYVWLDAPHGSRLLNEELLRAGVVRLSPKTLALCSSPIKRRLVKAAAERSPEGASAGRAGK